MGRTFILVFCLNLCLYLLDAHPALDPTIQQFQNGDNAYEDIEKNDEEFDLPKINLDHGYPDENDDYDLSSSNENDYNFEYNGHSSVEEDKTIHKDVKRENSGFFNETDTFDGGEEVVAKDEETSSVSTNETDHSKPEEVEVEPVGEIITTEGNEEDELISEPTNIEEEDLPQNNETIFQRSLENMPTHEDLTEDSSDDNEHISYFPPDVPPGPFAPHTRIVGGNKVTNREKFAYQASLRYVSNSHFCGATIIDETNLLTAAHCVYDDNHRLLPATRLLIVVGDLHVKEPTVDTMVRVVQHIFPHPNYNYKTFKNDIAVLRVESMGNFTEYINKVELAAQTPAVGTDCVVSGWGKTSFKGTASLQLMEVTVPILSTDTCMKGYGNAILEGMLCAGSMQGGKDACQGDSGGPLVCNNQLAGVVSWGYDCALKNYPGVYTDVAEYYTWIREQQGKSYANIINTNLPLIILNTFIVVVMTNLV